MTRSPHPAVPTAAALLMLLAAALLSAGRATAGPVEPAETVRGVESGSSDWRQVSVGDEHTCGIRTSGRLYCWGHDSDGQLGDGGTNTNRTTPTQVAGGATNWATVTAGDDHTCARKTNGRLFCWGSDGEGQLGTAGPAANQTIPVQVSGGATDWASVDAGNDHTCARKTNRRLFCWGDDGFGQLGNGGPNTNRPAPTQVAGGATNWASVDAGDIHTCARKTNRRIFCWGHDGEGQLGNGGPNTDRPAPTQVAGGATNWAAVTVGNAHTCARKTNRRLFCWGSDNDGQLGNGGPNTDRSTPTQVAGGATNWATVEAGVRDTCGRRTNRRLFCWGNDFDGQLGNGSPNTDRTTPTQVAGGATDWAGFNAGGFHTCARTITGRLYCWGNDSQGQLGDGGTNTNQPRPAEVFA